MAKWFFLAPITLLFTHKRNTMWHIAEMNATCSFNTHFWMAAKMLFLPLLAHPRAQWAQELPKPQQSSDHAQVGSYSCWEFLNPQQNTFPLSQEQVLPNPVESQHLKCQAFRSRAQIPTCVTGASKLKSSKLLYLSKPDPSRAHYT